VPDVATATHLCEQLAARFNRPGTALELFEIIADQTLRRALDHAELTLRDGTREAPFYAMVLVVCDVATGPSLFGSAFAEELITVLMSEVTGRDGTPLYPEGDVDFDHDPARLLHLRESCSEMSRLLPKQAYDIVVPVPRLDAFVNALTAAVAARHPEFQLGLFGHAGVGALHLHAVAVDQDTVDRAREALDRLVFDLVQEHGGSPWAEHGVGRKWGTEWQRRTPREVQQEMLAIKRRHDPDNVIGSRLFSFDVLLSG
jgi:FAD/FMN-containing dehydrogenase